MQNGPAVKIAPAFKAKTLPKFGRPEKDLASYCFIVFFCLKKSNDLLQKMSTFRALRKLNAAAINTG